MTKLFPFHVNALLKVLKKKKKIFLPFTALCLCFHLGRKFVSWHTINLGGAQDEKEKKEIYKLKIKYSHRDLFFLILGGS